MTANLGGAAVVESTRCSGDAIRKKGIAAAATPLAPAVCRLPFPRTIPVNPGDHQRINPLLHDRGV
jgi:hypothetical protein